jgi:hypothetical protein
VEGVVVAVCGCASEDGDCLLLVGVERGGDLVEAVSVEVDNFLGLCFDAGFSDCPTSCSVDILEKEVQSNDHSLASMTPDNYFLNTKLRPSEQFFDILDK